MRRDEPRGWRGADADLRHVEAAGAQAVGEAGENLDFPRGDPCERIGRFGVIPVSGVAQQTEKPEAGAGGNLACRRQRIRGVRIDAASMEPHVHFDQHVEVASSAVHHVRPLPGDVETVHDNREPHAILERQYPVRVHGVGGVGQPDVLDAGVGEHLGLAQLGAAHADRARVDLQARDGGALVGLRVRPQADAGAGRARLHRADVGLEPRAIDVHARRGNGVKRFCHLQSESWNL